MRTLRHGGVALSYRLSSGFPQCRPTTLEKSEIHNAGTSRIPQILVILSITCMKLAACENDYITFHVVTCSWWMKGTCYTWGATWITINSFLLAGLLRGGAHQVTEGCGRVPHVHDWSQCNQKKKEENCWIERECGMSDAVFLPVARGTGNAPILDSTAYL